MTLRHCTWVFRRERYTLTARDIRRHSSQSYESWNIDYGRKNLPQARSFIGNYQRAADHVRFISVTACNVNSSNEEEDRMLTFM